MTLHQCLFYFFASFSVIGSLLVIAAKNPVRSVLSLVFTFFCCAGTWMLLEAEFLAIILVLVYVGAVMVLFLFVVMMLDSEAPQMSKFTKHWPIGLLIAFIMLGLMGFLVSKIPALAEITPRPLDYSHVKVLGEILFNEYLLPFELAGIILLVAMIAAIVLTFRSVRRRVQHPGKQALVKKSERLRIVNLPSEANP